MIYKSLGTPSWLKNKANFSMLRSSIVALKCASRATGKRMAPLFGARSLSGGSHSDFGPIKKDVPEGLDEVSFSSILHRQLYIYLLLTKLFNDTHVPRSIHP